MIALSQQQNRCLMRLLIALVDQHAARTLVPPYADRSGFWFGGGNMVHDEEGTLWLVGRYRNYGDSRTGLSAGERGLECAVFCSSDGGASFHKTLSWTKQDLSDDGREILSIEGTSLHRLPDGTWELFISSEKAREYPAGLEAYRKPGTGVWSIDRVTGPAPDRLDLGTFTGILGNTAMPEHLHVKDPVVFDDSVGTTRLVFCTHPFTWASGNSGVASRRFMEESFHVDDWAAIHRGAAWDVASTRITARLSIPQVGVFEDAAPCSVFFHDGAECMRPHEENAKANARPRGYSCEELGGAFVCWNDAFPCMRSLSPLQPLFLSPWGTRCSRYVSCLLMQDGILTTWQQSRGNESQPLVGHLLPMDTVVDLLTP